MPDLGWLTGLAASARSEVTPLDHLLGFARALRAEGVAVGTASIIDFCTAASIAGPEDLYWVGRVTLLSNHQQLGIYESVFRGFFSGLQPSRPLVVPEIVERAVTSAVEPDIQPSAGRELGRSCQEASRLEILRNRSFDMLTADELRELALLITRTNRVVPKRIARRRQVSPQGKVDLHRTVRRALRTGGEPITAVRTKRRTKERRLVLLLDVSGSMTAYSRGLMLFAHSALSTSRQREAFCFGTRLTRVTRALKTADADTALTRAAEEVVDWDGGTRIGDSIKAFLDGYGHAGMARGAIVVVCSDGLETGDPAMLGEQMSRLNRLAYRTVWLNPLKATKGYAPLAGGMQQALPHVDVFEAGHTFASLEDLADRLAHL